MSPDFTTDGSHLPNNCSYFEYVGNKLYEYVAVIKLIGELATSEAARRSLFEGFMDSPAGELVKGDVYSGFARLARNRAEDHASAATDGSFEDWVNQFGHDHFGYSLPWAADGNAQAFHRRMATEETTHAGQLQEAADFHYALAWEEAANFFKSLWEAIKKRWRECGILYAVALTATDATFFVGELALGAGVSAGAIKLLKSVKFTAHISLPAVSGAVSGAAVEGARVTKDTLITAVAIIGVPGSAIRRLVRTYKAGELHDEFKLDDVHAGGLAEDAQTPIKEGMAERKKDRAEADNHRKGRLAEAAGRKRLAAEGFTDIRELKNNSEHGVDLIGRNPSTGAVKMAEVKANGAGLNELQDMGGPKYLQIQLDNARLGKSAWKSMPNGMDEVAEDVSDWIINTSSKQYEIWKYDVDDAGSTLYRGKANWDWKPGEKPKRLTYRNDAGKPARKPKTVVPPAIGPPSSAVD